MAKVYLYDTTLRDGAQQEGISLSLDDKLKITKKLDEAGISYIEGGWPGSNPKDEEYFKEVAKLKLNNSIVINGNGLDEDVLNEANLEDVETILALTNDDEDNLMVSILVEKFSRV